MAEERKKRKRGPGDEREALRRITLFSDVTDSEADAVLAHAREQRVRKGTVVFHRFDKGGHLYLIVEGSVKISRVGRDGREVTITTLRQGNFFGERSILDGQGRSANATALSACRFLVLDRGVFLADVLSMRGVFPAILAELSKRLRAADQYIEYLALGTVFDRLFHFLGHWGRRFPLVEGRAVITSRPTHQELSEILGCSRETVTRTLAAMEKRGLIEIRRRHLVLPPAFFEEEAIRA